ncbi:ubiquinol-cytochrome C chaperone [Methylobacterium sp. E-041]|uniref:ubiquinol-cytochrome C chaperone family protein n=1 Tax=unclassified Methylobacterium TaxID=2615210 RepID=UPI0011C8FFAD|nr:MULTISPECIES: ubiquinol-cytochrome C chaperone family protein [unclassified Methylobacterium]MCJ2008422.1 ubiquinol-cytochrome C chaperone [Methylobacterium sp. J-092]MCJ2041209.1 ubiquinol-cytochrome C chaperone [Methylobacterium sp. J-059]MCJ2109454.1 ubiquinol-cytochrome C chaperone [Methylobacterium sp. E-041]TXN71125.1 ubiquinol-cytochrome C chaperone [Methylobacterium sp. WL6]
MITRFFRRNDARRRSIETLHMRLNAASRQPGLYTALGVPDGVEGRFESLILHVILALRRLNRLPAPAADVAQDLVNSVFLQLDASLRELGVGDFGVPKRMKKLGAAFYGRAANYDAALDAGDAAALRIALARNVLGSEDPEAAAGLADYVLAADRALAEADLDGLLGAGPSFPHAGDAPTLDLEAR